MVIVAGMKVYETLPAHVVDLDSVTVCTLDAMIEDEQTCGTVGDFNVTNSGTTPDGIAWGFIPSNAPELVPEIVIDKEIITEAVLVSLATAGVIKFSFFGRRPS